MNQNPTDDEAFAAAALRNAIPYTGNLDEMAKAAGFVLAEDDEAGKAEAEFLHALSINCAKDGHDHFQPYVESTLAETLMCYLRQFRGTKVEFEEDGGWFPGTVREVMWRADGFAVEADDDGQVMRLTFASGRVRLA